MKPTVIIAFTNPAYARGVWQWSAAATSVSAPINQYFKQSEAEVR